MKKLLAILLAVLIGLFSTVSTADTVTVDRPVESKTYEWFMGYAHRCGMYRNKRYYAYKRAYRMYKRERVKYIAKCVAFIPLRLMVGVASAETTPDERYYYALAQGGTKEQALDAYNGSEVKPTGKRVSHPKWANIEPDKVEFVSAEELSNPVFAKRGWFSAAKLNGFGSETVLAYQWFKPDDPEAPTPPPEYITFHGKKYILWCAGQGGVKKGAAMYLPVVFLEKETNGVKNSILLDAPIGLPVNKVNQVRALRFTACKPSKATNKQLIVMVAKQRIDDAKDIVDGRPVIKIDVPNGYERSEADKVEQALADGAGVAGPKSGISGPAAQLRNDGGLKCAVVKYLSRYIGKTVIDAFGRSVIVTEESILSTTDNHKDIKPFLKKIEIGEMTGEEAYQAWLEAQGGPEGLIYECPVHPQNGRVRLGRQIFGKFSQLSEEALFRVVSKDLGKLAELGFENGYKNALKRKYAALRMPELAGVLDHPFLYQDAVRSYLSKWHDIASGAIEVNGSLALAVIDPVWFDDIYVGGKSVDDPTAGVVAAGTILFGRPGKDGHNPLIGKKVVLGRFPQVKSGLPVVTVAGSAYASGLIVVSGRPGDMVLQDLDADLDGDKPYVIDEEAIVEAVEKANKVFNFPHIIFTKWEASEEKETLAEYLGRNAQWQSEESVGSFATHQFVIDEMVPLLEEGQDWKKLPRPTLDENGNYGEYTTLEEAFKTNEMLGVGGNMATDSGKLNHKPDAPKGITKRFAFRPMSQRDAHPNDPDSGFKKRLAAFLPDLYPGVALNILKRVHDLLMKFVPITETGRTATNDFIYDEETGRIIPDVPQTLWRPARFEPIPDAVFMHMFGNELDQIKTSLICHPNDVEIEELNNDLQVFTDADEGISLVTYFTKYATKIVDIEHDLDDDKKGWTVSGRDTFGDNLILFVKTAIKRKDVSDEDCLWLAYNALCKSFFGSESSSRGTAFAFGQFLNLFEKMLIAQVCHNTGAKPPKLFGEKVSIKDSVTKSTSEQTVPALEMTDEEPPANIVIDEKELRERLLTQVNNDIVDEEPPTANVDLAAMMKQLEAQVAQSSDSEDEWEIGSDDNFDEDEEF